MSFDSNASEGPRRQRRRARLHPTLERGPMLSSGAMTLDLATTLSDRVRGRVIVPRDSDYDEARSVFNGMLDHRPRFIVRPVDAADVASRRALGGRR